jgi:hypothetical protein
VGSDAGKVQSALADDLAAWKLAGKTAHPRFVNLDSTLRELLGIAEDQVTTRFVSVGNTKNRLSDAATYKPNASCVVLVNSGDVLIDSQLEATYQEHIQRNKAELILVFGSVGNSDSANYEAVRLVALADSPLRRKFLEIWPEIVELQIDNPGSIRRSFCQIAEMQSLHTSDYNNPQMLRRSELLDDLATVVSARLNYSAAQSIIRVNAHPGHGSAIVTPYLRIFDSRYSRNAQSGFYICTFVSADGSALLVSLQQGAMKWDGKNLKNLPKAELENSSQFIYNKVLEGKLHAEFIEKYALNREFQIEGITGEIGPRIKIFKNSNIISCEFSMSSLPNDSELVSVFNRFFEIASELNSSDPGPLSMESVVATLLCDQIFWEQNRVDALFDSLKEKPQIVLYGPPGTGKTFVAQAIASELLENNGGFDEERVTLVQFHPSYGYEDFVEGLRPVSKANGIVFETVAGEIVKLSKLIQNDGQPRVLIIDEINRANIPRVFGELMYLLEYRDKKINLMLHDGFMLPKDLYVIATMNTADKSTRVMDSALRRRFDFFSLEPDVIVLKKYYADSANHNEIGEELFEGFVALNSALLTDLDRHRLIGHSYFMKDVFSLQTLRARWERQIAPLIEEYFFDRDTYGTSYTVERFWPSAKA